MSDDYSIYAYPDIFKFPYGYFLTPPTASHNRRGFWSKHMDGQIEVVFLYNGLVKDWSIVLSPKNFSKKFGNKEFEGLEYHFIRLLNNLLSVFKGKVTFD